MRIATKRGPEQVVVQAAGRALTVPVKRNPRARRLILRLDAGSGLPVLTVPAHTPLAQAERFLHRHLGWLEQRLARQHSAAPFRDGAQFPLRGVPCRIAHRGGRGLVRLDAIPDGTALSVPGELAHLPRRVGDWLKRQARDEIGGAVALFAAEIGRAPAAIRIGDPRSRWGSCSSAGTLSFSWRLILAPPFVLRYLAAHEVAHLVEMNHSRKFWAVVRRLDPECDAARAWLKRNGAGLHAIGRNSANG